VRLRFYMHDQPISVFSSDPTPKPERRPNWLMRWWGSLPASRQDRIAALSPVASILLFLAVIALTFAYLRIEELGREQSALAQDMDYAHERLKMRLLEEQEQLVGLTMSYGGRLISDEEFVAQAQAPSAVFLSCMPLAGSRPIAW